MSDCRTSESAGSGSASKFVSEAEADVRLDGDEMAADADDGDAVTFRERTSTLHPRTTRVLRTPRARARFVEGTGVLHSDCDEEARPRSGYRPGAPGGRRVEHVDEHLRAAAWMGASPLPPAWCRVTNLYAGHDHHSRDSGWRDRAHRTTSQSGLTVDKAPRRTAPRDAGHAAAAYMTCSGSTAVTTCEHEPGGRVPRGLPGGVSSAG
jgi:hypothetical protein